MKLETPDFVREATEAGFLLPEAAGRLLEAKARERGEVLERATRALEHLDPDRVHVPEPAWSFVRAFAQLVVALLYSTDHRARARLAPLLRRVLSEAVDAGKAEQAEVAAERARWRESEAWTAREEAAAKWRADAERTA